MIRIWIKEKKRYGICAPGLCEYWSGNPSGHTCVEVKNVPAYKCEYCDFTSKKKVSVRIHKRVKRHMAKYGKKRIQHRGGVER